MKTLVVYFSRKGYVNKIAEQTAKENNADIYEVKTKEHINGVLGFLWCGRFAMHRWTMPIETISMDVAAYDKVIICSPVWVFTVSAPIRAFLEQCSGKIKAADYILVHFSYPMNYDKTIALMDKTIKIKHDAFTSISCQFGVCRKAKQS